MEVDCNVIEIVQIFKLICVLYTRGDAFLMFLCLFAFQQSNSTQRAKH